MASYSGLFDYKTKILLTISGYPAVIAFLAEGALDASAIHAIDYPNYKETFFLASIPPEQYVQWKWDARERIFKKTEPALITDNLRERSQLAVGKAYAIGSIMSGLARARYQFSKGIILQETVYLTKKLQAQAFRDSGYDEDRLIEYPYVVQYADMAGISLRQAADDIIFKAKLADDGLAKTEFLRLKYFDLVRKTKGAGELDAIVKQFLLDCFYSQLT